MTTAKLAVSSHCLIVEHEARPGELAGLPNADASTTAGVQPLHSAALQSVGIGTHLRSQRNVAAQQVMTAVALGTVGVQRYPGLPSTGSHSALLARNRCSRRSRQPVRRRRCDRSGARISLRRRGWCHAVGPQIGAEPRRGIVLVTRPHSGRAGVTAPRYPSLASPDVVEIQGDTGCVVAVQSGVVIGGGGGSASGLHGGFRGAPGFHAGNRFNGVVRRPGFVSHQRLPFAARSFQNRQFAPNTVPTQFSTGFPWWRNGWGGWSGPVGGWLPGDWGSGGYYGYAYHRRPRRRLLSPRSLSSIPMARAA